MDAGVVIIALAVIQVGLMGAIGLAGWKLFSLGQEEAARLRRTVAPAHRVRARALEAVQSGRAQAERIAGRGRALVEDLSRKWQRLTHLVEETVHPGRPAVERVAEPIARGRRLAERLARLSAAAQKAAGSRR